MKLKKFLCISSCSLVLLTAKLAMAGNLGGEDDQSQCPSVWDNYFDCAQSAYVSATRYGIHTGSQAEAEQRYNELESTCWSNVVSNSCENYSDPHQGKKTAMYTRRSDYD